MRLFALVIVLSLLTIVAAGPAEARPAPACTEFTGNCPEFVCADTDLDGKFQWDECIGYACPTWGCCGTGCPPPAAEADVGATDALALLSTCEIPGCQVPGFALCVASEGKTILTNPKETVRVLVECATVTTEPL